ncbi:Acyl-CoA-binding domain-containing protein 3 [Citrus sinensis]|uniref:Acyl-CoA-binding domain-containing protein 3 n=1 Tax=Citrus sinensis TaxID=2711 RepID=A0ACB8J3F8_CITSI|nr:Acyl-CoA-binding domain-containing protein 3 [Citrus sinensis]
MQRGSETEKTHGFVAKVVEGASETQEKILLDDCCGSCDDVKIGDNEVLKEVEMERVVEEHFGEFGGGESESNAKFGTGLTKDEVSVARSEEIEFLESKCEARKIQKDDGSKCSTFDCKETLMDKNNFFESEKMAKIEAESTKTVTRMTESEETEVSKSNCDNKVDEANKNQEDGGESSIFNCKQILVYRSNFFESENIAAVKSESAITEVGMARSEEIEVLESNCDNEIGERNRDEEDDVKVVSFDEDDDWEGIERTELERLFGAAVAFVGNKCNAGRISSIGSDVKMQLYGLHKIATVGPCREPQPMALKVSARANWNAWKQLGNMTPEIAMEQYVTILSRSIPGCIQDGIGGDIKPVSADAEACGELVCDLKAYQVAQLGAVDKSLSLFSRNVDELVRDPEVPGFSECMSEKTPEHDEYNLIKLHISDVKSSDISNVASENWLIQAKQMQFIPITSIKVALQTSLSFSAIKDVEFKAWKHQSVKYAILLVDLLVVFANKGLTACSMAIAKCFCSF